MSENLDERKLLTLAEVADQLRFSRSKLYADQRAGKLRVLRFGRLIRIRRQDLQHYIRLAAKGVTRRVSL